ncbi:MAG: hypothetical protein Q7V56_15235 [Gammaproteobacteria bacterium]|nr:hypothetical protein [Gammaproteobacteria bacterium]
MRNADATIFESLDASANVRREPCLALPQPGDLSWARQEQPYDRQGRQGLQARASPSLIPVVASLAMHTLALALLLGFGLQTEPPVSQSSVASIRLRIIPPAPAQPPILAPAETANPPTRTAPPEPTPQIVDRLPLTQEPTLTAQPATPSPALRFPATPPQVEQDVERDAERTQLRLPSTLDMRRIIDDIGAREQARLALPECTPLQDERTLIDCEEANALNFDALDRNSTYSYFNSQREISRTQRTIGVLAAQANVIEDGVRAAGIDPIAAATLLNTLNAAAEDYSGTGNARLERIRDEAYRNDSTYQQMLRVMNPR